MDTREPPHAAAQSRFSSPAPRQVRAPGQRGQRRRARLCSWYSPARLSPFLTSLSASRSFGHNHHNCSLPPTQKQRAKLLTLSLLALRPSFPPRALLPAARSAGTGARAGRPLPCAVPGELPPGSPCLSPAASSNGEGAGQRQLVPSVQPAGGGTARAGRGVGWAWSGAPGGGCLCSQTNSRLVATCLLPFNHNKATSDFSPPAAWNPCQDKACYFARQ